MNISYRSVWNHAIGAWVAVSEIARGRGKHGRSARRARTAMSALAVAALALSGASGHAQTSVTAGTLVVSTDAQLGGDYVTVDSAAATLQVNAGVSIGNEIVLNNQGTLNNAGTISRTALDDTAVRSDEGGAKVNNAATGRIVGDYMGVSLADGGTVTNTGGTISAAAADGNDKGVYIHGQSGSVVNQAGGTITAQSIGVQLAAGGSVTNDGSTIAASGGDGWGVYVHGGLGVVTNRNGGRITGVEHGVNLEAGGTVDNLGTGSVISASGVAGTGLTIGGTGTVTNSGTIEASGVNGQGVVIGGGTAQVTNAGTIGALGNGGRGMYLWADGADTVTVTNEGGGKIAGHTTGVQINGRGTLTNSGEISATAAYGEGVYFGTARGTVTNQQGGTITGVSAGVLLDAGGTVTNTGAGSAISATGADSRGVFIDGAGTVSNTAGSITGGHNGVAIWGAGTVTNTGGTLLATTDGTNVDGGHGVEIVGGLGTVINQGGGTLTGKLYGVSLADGGTITNSASTISADGADPLAAGVGISGAAGTVTNTGAGSLIKGPSAGVRLINGGSVTNGVGATIEGTASVQVVGGNTTLSNAGALKGNVTLRSAGNNKVTLFTGSSVTGNLGIGTNAASTLTLDGLGDQRYSTAVSGNTSFSAGTLVKQGLGTWTLDKAMARSGTTQVNAGTLAVAHGSGLGSGTVTADNIANLGATLAIDSGVSIGNAVIVNNTGTLNNAGTISRTAAGQKAVISATGVATVNNAATGRIEGDTRGVDLANGGTVTNAGGTIHANATGSYGAVTGGVAATISNTLGGTISGIQAGVAVWGSGSNTVDNDGATITASIGNAVYVQNSGATVTNRGGGKITGKASGVFLVSGGTLINDVDSTIEGTAGVAVVSNSGGTAVTLRNAGTLIGNVSLASPQANEAHEITLYSGSRIVGGLQANTQASTLTLDGVGDQLYSKAVTGTTTFAGTLVKQGAGTWTLDQTQNGLTTGNARVEAGTLNVGTRLNSASVNVLNGAILTGGGTLAGAVDVADGGHLALRSGSTLSAASLVLHANSNLDVALGAPSDTRLLTLSGNLTLDGQLNVSDAGGFGRGAYRLIDYGGTLTNNGLDLGDRPLGYKAGDMAVQTSIAKQVNLVVGASAGTLRFWNGNVLQADGAVHGGSGIWNAGDTNWTTTDGTASQAWAHDFGIFAGTGGTVTVNGAHQFSGLQFAADGYALANGVSGKLTAVNDSDGYAQIRVDPGATARIDVAIDGDGSLEKRDRGTLVLGGRNSYLGGTKVSGGTLQAAHDEALGTGTVTINDSAQLGANLTINKGVTLTNGVTLEGGGTLNNAGTLSRTFSGQIGVGSNSGVGTVNNLQGATIAGSAHGVLMEDGGTVNNSGTISASDTQSGIAVAIRGRAGTVHNTAGGALLGQSSGVFITMGGTVTNTGGTIASAHADGISTVDINGPLTVSNTAGGKISGSTNGVLAAGESTVTNTASTITATDGRGLFLLGEATVTNTGGGTISGTTEGVHLVSGGTLRNGVGSTVQGGDASVASGSDASVTLSNAGRLIGHVALSESDRHQVTLFSGSSITGDLRIGTRTESTLTLDGTGDQRYAEAVTGATTFDGSLRKQGSGRWTLDRSRDLVYSGDTTVAAGTLAAGAANALSPNSAHSVALGATLGTGGFDQRLPSLHNAGTVDLRSAGRGVGGTLTVTGAYVGGNGVLQVGTTLGDSTSTSDRLLLSGASAVASGSTQVQVTNVAGLGALTTGNGIAVVATENGGRIEANAFSLVNGHVDAGAFEYRMAGDAEGLYLRSTAIPVDSPVVPSTGPTSPLYRAEVPLLSALPEQLREANLAMLANRHQRLGDSVGATALAGTRQAWGRILTVQRDIDQGGPVAPQSHGRLSGFQAGTDLYSGGSAQAQWQAGLYVGQLDGDMSASGFARGVANLQVGHNTLKNQYLGAYGSYQDGSGLYAEGVLQAARHRYDVASISSSGAHGKGSSLLASLEVGQAFPLAPGWRIEPQLQLIHQSLDLDDLSLGGLTGVDQDTRSGWTARAGLRLQGELATGLGTLKPYGRLNLYKSPNGTDSTSYRTPAALTVLGTPTGGTRAEVAAGATLGLSERASLYGEIGQLSASGGRTRTRGGVNASLGLKIRW